MSAGKAHQQGATMEDKMHSNKEEFDDSARMEFYKIERDFRKMLSDKEAMTKKTQTILANQKKIIKILEKEKHVLLEQIEFQSKAKEHDKLANKTVKEIASLLKKYEATKSENKEKELQLQDLRTSIKKILSQINDYKVQHATESKDHEKEEKTDELLQCLLAEEAAKFNQIITENDELRKETDNLLIERIKFNKMFDDFIKDLASGKKMVFDLIEQSNAAYDKRRKIVIHTNSLQSEAKKEFRSTAREAWDVKQKIEYLENLNKFVEVKGKIHDQSTILAEKQMLGEGILRELGDNLQFQQGLIKKLTTDFRQQDLSKLVLHFTKIEEDNFNIFAFLNDQNSRINGLSNELESLIDAIEVCKVENAANKLKTEAHMYELDEELESKKQELVNLVEFVRELEKNCVTFFEGIKEIFNILKCDWTPFHQMLGDNEAVTGHNFKTFMVDIENRLRMICTHFSVMHYQAAKKTAKIRKMTQTFSQRSMSTHSHVDKTLYGIDVIVSAVRTTLPPTPCPLCVEFLDSSDKVAVVTPLDPKGIKPIVEEERKKGRWRAVMHPLAECPLPQAQRIMQKKQMAS